MPFPFYQGLLQKLLETLCLPRIVPGGPQVREELLLAAQSLPPILDIPLRFEQECLLCLELLGRSDRKGCHAAT